jgi:hypothetical protein
MNRDVPLRLVLVGELLWLLNRAYTAVMRCHAWRWTP